MSWVRRLSWKYVVEHTLVVEHVVGNIYVVDVCRGQQSFHRTCRGDNESMSWNTSMSWKYVVEHMLYDVACRGYQYVVDVCRGEQSFSGA